MIHNHVINFLTKRILNHRVMAVRSSALFINGSKATEQFTYISPHIDIEEINDKSGVIQQQLQRRNCSYDMSKLQNLYYVYEKLKAKKTAFDRSKEIISRELGHLIKNDPENININKLKIQSSLVKDNIKNLKVPLWSAEEAFMVEVLKLPNILHPMTPDGIGKTIYTQLIQPKTQKDHLKIGSKLDIINFKKNESYYFHADAAVFELGAKFYFSNFLKKEKFIQFSNPDFVKSLIVEGCGLDHTNPDSTFILHHNEDTNVHVDNRMHLTGGGSLCAFMAYHAKNSLYPKVFPLKYFCMGRQYAPSPSDEDSLYHVSQSSVIQFFGAAKSSDELNDLLEELIELLKTAYSNLGYHFHLKIIPAEKLSMWESMRVVVEMFSSSMNTYIEIANLSVSGDYISKRLQFTFIENKTNKFPYLISGTLLNVPKFLACVLEQDEVFHVPKLFKVENWNV